jgi:hypothetical protein
MGASPSKCNEKLLALHDATACGNVRAVRKLLQQGAHPALFAVRDGAQLPCSLLLAVLQGDIGALHVMYTFSHNVNALVSPWHNSMQASALLGDSQLVRWLITEGAAVSGPLAGAPAPLAIAASAEVAVELLSAGAQLPELGQNVGSVSCVCWYTQMQQC